MELLIGNVNDNMKKKTALTTTGEIKLERIKARGMELIEVCTWEKDRTTLALRSHPKIDNAVTGS
jgi:hypothetical protein